MKAGINFPKKVHKLIVIDILISFDSFAILLYAVTNLIYSFGPAFPAILLGFHLGWLVLGPEITKLLINITGDKNCLYLVIIAHLFSWLQVFLLGCLACTCH